MKKLIGANFKMNKSNAELKAYFEAFIPSIAGTEVEVTIAPQTASLSFVSELTKNSPVQLAAQNMYFEEKGAFTGETSPLLLNELGTKYVILGHGERRGIFGESDELINKKILSAIAHGIRPIFCVGETLAQREAGQTNEVMKKQMEIGLAGVDASQVDIAYEPIRAIGTGKAASSQDIIDAHAFIRSMLGNQTSRILYGGSANDANAAEIIALPEVNGFLVGSASLDPVKFKTMIDLMK